MTQSDPGRLEGFRIGIHRAIGKLSARGFNDPLRAPLAGPVRDPDVRAALETIGSVGAQIERLRGAPNVRRLEISAFDQYVFGLLVDLGVLSAHDTCQRDGLGFIGDEQHVPRQSSLLAVQRDKQFAVLRPTNDDSGR